MIISNNIIIRIKNIYIKWYLCNCVACPQRGTYKITNAIIFFFFLSDEWMIFVLHCMSTTWSLGISESIIFLKIKGQT